MKDCLLKMTAVQLIVITAARYLEDAVENEGVVVPCSSCDRHTCSGERLCQYGVFRNEMCNDELECYKAPGDPCGETVRRVLGRCAPGLHCRCGVCVGHLFNKAYDSSAPCRQGRGLSKSRRLSRGRRLKGR